MFYKDYIKDVPDHPVKGILFRDIQPLLANHQAFERATNDMLELSEVYHQADYFVGVESRGFIFSTAMAWSASRGNILIRKKGKLPPEGLKTISYKTEYSTDEIEMKKGKGKVIIVDDVYATGGTMNAAEDLCKLAGYEVIDSICLLNIGLVKNPKTKCLISY
jgi:adenine phosphoribosyltransferase